MNEEPLLAFEPSALIFQVELNKQLSSSIRLSNNSANTVIYKLFTTSPKKYGVRPKIGVLQPGSVCDIRVTTRPIKETPPKKCKDKFMIRSAVANPSATSEDAPNMFNKEAGDVFHECQLRVVYNMPYSSPKSSLMDHSPNISEVISPDIQPDDSAVAPMSQAKLLEVQPPELEVTSNSQKDASWPLQLSNVTEDHVAFRVKTMSSKYLIQPIDGILPPKSTFDVAVKIQVEVPSDVQSEDKLLIQSMVSAPSLTTEDIQDMFDKASSPIEECELQVAFIPEQEKDTAQADDFILRVIIICLFVLVLCYITKQTLSVIWSLAMLGLMLLIKMVKKLVSDSVEDWVVKTLLYLIMYVCGRRQVES